MPWIAALALVHLAVDRGETFQLSGHNSLLGLDEAGACVGVAQMGLEPAREVALLHLTSSQWTLPII